jgi:RNA polymerase sigma-70 factor (ECF subfamily)
MWLLWAVIAGPPGTTAADHTTLERMARGDHEALAELYDRHSRLVYSLALRIIRDEGEAEDIVQEVFSQAWRQAGGNVIAWLLNLTRSRAIDRLRGRQSRPEAASESLPAIDLPDLAMPVDEQLSLEGRASRVRAAMKELSVLQRVAIELAFYEGLTHVEIAERLELPLGTVKTRIRQGLLKLKDRLAGVM